RLRSLGAHGRGNRESLGIVAGARGLHQRKAQGGRGQGRQKFHGDSLVVRVSKVTARAGAAAPRRGPGAEAYGNCLGAHPRAAPAGDSRSRPVRSGVNTSTARFRGSTNSARAMITAAAARRPRSYFQGQLANQGDKTMARIKITALTGDALAVAALALLLAACGGGRVGALSAEQYNAAPLTVAIPQGTANAVVIDAAEQALTGRGWRVVSRSD